MMKLNVAILFGGRSVEHEVSIISALQCLETMEATNKYDTTPIYISKEGIWYTGSALRHIENYKQMDQLLSKCKPVVLSPNANEYFLLAKNPGIFGKHLIARLDVIFPIFHGSYGEDGCMQGLFELMNIPYVGCDVLSSGLCMDKMMSRGVLREQGLPVLHDIHFFGAEWLKNRQSLIDQIESTLTYPVMAKPNNLGSSVGVAKAVDRESLEEAIDAIVGLSMQVIIEPCIESLQEINCAVLGDHDEVVVSICEEPIKTSDLLTFEDKYAGGGKKMGGMSAAKRQIPANISPDMTETIQKLAKQAFSVLKCSGVVRFDFLIDRQNQRLYLNEANTIPGSLAFYLWEPAGVSFSTLINRLINLAIKRFREKQSLVSTYPSNILSDYSSFGAKGSKGGRIK